MRYNRLFLLSKCNFEKKWQLGAFYGFEAGIMCPVCSMQMKKWVENLPQILNPSPCPLPLALTITTRIQQITLAVWTATRENLFKYFLSTLDVSGQPAKE